MAVLLLAGCLGYFVIRSKVQKVSQTLFGTKSLLDGLEQQADVLAIRQKICWLQCCRQFHRRACGI